MREQEFPSGAAFEEIVDLVIGRISKEYDAVVEHIRRYGKHFFARRFEVDVDGFDRHVWKSVPNLTYDLKSVGTSGAMAAEIHDKPGVHGRIIASHTPGYINATYKGLGRMVFFRSLTDDVKRSGL